MGKKRCDAMPNRDYYRHFLLIPTRWIDNDIYGHINNAVYYSYFDTVINEYLISQGGLNIHQDPVVGYAVETFCRFHRPISFPEQIEAGLRARQIGRSSITYEVGLFSSQEELAGACGHFVHVFVDRATGRSTAIPPGIVTAVQRLKA